MSMKETEWIWMNGELVRWAEARVHVMSHALHYGSSVFEGLRVYETPTGPAIFRLNDHVRRLFESCRMYRMDLPYEQRLIELAIIDTVRANHLGACYVRPVVYRGYSELGLDPRPCPVDVAIAAFPWGRYLGEDSGTRGVDVKVSSWRRLAPDTLPALAKAGANYMNSQLMKMDALVDGYAEAIGLDSDGFVSEGSGENIFVVRNGTLITPPWDSSVLMGITRDSVIALARDMNVQVEERRIPRELLYVADEVFLTGTAAEVTPVRSVDRVNVGRSIPGPITSAVERSFEDLVHGHKPDRYGWMVPITDGARRTEAMHST